MNCMLENNHLLAVVKLAMRLGRRCLTPYSHPKSPQRFTQPQLMACLILKAHQKTTYRGVIELLELSAPLRSALGFTHDLPHYTTIQKFAASDGVMDVLDSILGDLVRMLGDGKPLKTPDIAVDSTGLQTGMASAHYRTRSKRQYTKWIRVSVAGICALVMPASMVIDWGPGNDAKPAVELLEKASLAVQPERVWGDAAYDSERVHAYCYEKMNARSYAPLIHRRNTRVVRGRYRPKMRKRPRDYGRRWTIESLFSALKRTMGSALSSRLDHTMKVEAGLRVVTYAIRR